MTGIFIREGRLPLGGQFDGNNSISPKPTDRKGKGVDPRNWGHLQFRNGELDPGAQQQEIDHYAQPQERLQSQQQDTRRDFMQHGPRSDQPEPIGSTVARLAALGCVSVLFAKQNQGNHGVALLNYMSTRDAVKKCLGLSSQWTSESNLSLEDCENLPLLRATLKSLWPGDLASGEQSYPSTMLGLSQALGRLVAESPADSCAALVISRSTKIIAVLKIPISAQRNEFAVCDLPTRAKPSGSASLVFHRTSFATVSHLAQLFPAEEAPRFDENLGIQQQPLGSVTTRAYTRNRPSGYPEDTALLFNSSVEILLQEQRVRAREDELRTQERTETPIQQRIQNQADRIEELKSALSVLVTHKNHDRNLYNELKAQKRDLQAAARDAFEQGHRDSSADFQAELQAVEAHRVIAAQERAELRRRIRYWNTRYLTLHSEVCRQEGDQATLLQRLEDLRDQKLAIQHRLRRHQAKLVEVKRQGDGLLRHLSPDVTTPARNGQATDRSRSCASAAVEQTRRLLSALTSRASRTRPAVI